VGSHRIHRSLLLRRNSHRFVEGYGIPAIPTHPATAMFSHRFHGFTQMVRLRSGLPQNSQNTQNFIAEKKLPQISRIYTDVSKMFCVFREFCGSKYLYKSVKSVGEYSLPVCSVCSVNSVGVKYLCKSVKSVGEYSLPVCSVYSVNSVGVKYLCKSVNSVGEYSLPVCSVCSVNSVGVNICVNL
jgi:hypothetical protein